MYMKNNMIYTDEERPSWNEYYMEMVEVIKKRSTCLSRKVGAIIVDEHYKPVSMGYNGPAKWMKHCGQYTNGCLRKANNIPSGEKLEYCRALHAECNAILQANRDLSRCTIYISFSPCVSCAKMIVAKEIRRVIYKDEYPANDLALEILKEANVEVIKL